MKGTQQRCEKEFETAADVGQLLYRLKSIVERVLLSRASGVGGNVWLAFGGLVELVVVCVGDILKHGLKSRIREDESILEWLKNTFDYPIGSVNRWINDSLLQYCLRDQFLHLLHNRLAVEDIYCPDAFLRLPSYVESLFLCLQALEEQQHKLLTEIDPALYMVSLYGKSLNDMRSLSFPVLSTSVHKFTSMESFSNNPSSVDQKNCQSDYCYHCVHEVLNQLLFTVSSHLQEQERDETKSLDGSITMVDSKLQAPPATKSKNISSIGNHRRTRSDDAFLRRLPITRLTTPTQSEFGGGGNSSNLTSRQNISRLGSMEYIKESWMEAAKLRDFIQQREYETSLELERENAHFLLSEMLIGSIEQMKWRNVLSTQWPNHQPSIESAANNARPIRSNGMEEELASASFEGHSDNSSSDNLLSTSSDLQQSSSYEDSGDFRRDVDAVTSMSGRQQAGPSVDTGYGTDGRRSIVRDSVQNSTASSAESVAMNLLQRFSQRHFPPTESNDMKFLVSYKDVPQMLLPLPQSMPVAPDEVYAEGFKQKVKLRGTFEWAPPRPQLIFRKHPVPKLKPLLESQSFKCAGCGMKLEKAYFKRLRYCAYLGKLFCQRCHQGQTSTIPGHVLYDWDFRRLPVSDFSYRFLQQQYTAPVWNVKVVNEALYNSVKHLRTVRSVRHQVHLCYDYVRTCRLAKDLITTNGRLTDVFENLPSHLIQETDVYSMQDFVQVKDGTLFNKLEAALLLARYHIESCQYCRAKGFVCEVCQKDEILFPFQANGGRVKRCNGCGSCFHMKCLRKRECPKCKRLQVRRELATQNIIEQDDESELEA